MPRCATVRSRRGGERGRRECGVPPAGRDHRWRRRRAGRGAGARAGRAPGHAARARPAPTPATPGGAFAAERRGAPQVAPDPRLPGPHRRRAPPAVPRRARRPARRRLHGAARRPRPRRAPARRRGPGRAHRAAHHVRDGCCDGPPSASRASRCARGSAWPASPPPRARRRRIDGVRLDDGTVVPADIVVAATGRRDQVVPWLADVGVDVPETVIHSGLVYLSRWYRLPPDDEVTLDPKLGGDLGYREVPRGPRRRRHAVDHARGAGGRQRAAQRPRRPRPLRAGLHAPAGARPVLRPTARSSRIGGVRPMGGLLNRLRRFVDDDGTPVVLGFHAVGDAHTCTNPLYGRGCSLALVQAVAARRRRRRPPRRPGRPRRRLRGRLPPRGRAVVRPRGADGRRRAPTRAATTVAGSLEPAGPGDGGPVRGRRRPTRSSAGPSPASGTCWPRRADLAADPVDSPGRMPRSWPTPTPTRRRRATARRRAELLDALARSPAGTASAPTPTRSPTRRPSRMTDHDRRVTGDAHRRHERRRPARRRRRRGHAGRARPRVPRAGLLVAPPDPGPRRRRLPRARPGPAGLRALQPRPTPIEDYDIVHLTDDLLGLLDDIGERAGRVRRPRLGVDGRLGPGPAAIRSASPGVVGMSVPFVPRGRLPPVAAHAPGVRRQLLLHPLLPGARRRRRRPRRATRPRRCAACSPALTTAGGGDATRRSSPTDGRGFVDRLPEPDGLPDWLSAGRARPLRRRVRRAPASPAASTGTATSTATGSSPPRSAAPRSRCPRSSSAARDDPVLMMTPAVDDGAAGSPTTAATSSSTGAGHWVQQEKPDAVNAALLEFVDAVHGEGS